MQDFDGATATFRMYMKEKGNGKWNEGMGEVVCVRV